MEHGIDFDEGIRAWRTNKKRIRGGSFLYICVHICKNGKQCKNHLTDCGLENDRMVCKYHSGKKIL